MTDDYSQSDDSDSKSDVGLRYKVEGAPGEGYEKRPETYTYTTPKRGNTGVTPHHQAAANSTANMLSRMYNDPAHKKDVFDQMLKPGSDHKKIWDDNKIADTKPYERFARVAHNYNFYTGLPWDPNQTKATITAAGTDRDKRMARTNKKVVPDIEDKEDFLDVVNRAQKNNRISSEYIGITPERIIRSSLDGYSDSDKDEIVRTLHGARLNFPTTNMFTKGNGSISVNAYKKKLLDVYNSTKSDATKKMLEDQVIKWRIDELLRSNDAELRDLKSKHIINGSNADEWRESYKALTYDGLYNKLSSMGVERLLNIGNRSSPYITDGIDEMSMFINGLGSDPSHMYSVAKEYYGDIDWPSEIARKEAYFIGKDGKKGTYDILSGQNKNGLDRYVNAKVLGVNELANNKSIFNQAVDFMKQSQSGSLFSWPIRRLAEQKGLTIGDGADKEPAIDAIKKIVGSGGRYGSGEERAKKVYDVLVLLDNELDNMVKEFPEYTSNDSFFSPERFKYDTMNLTATLRDDTDYDNGDILFNRSRDTLATLKKMKDAVHAYRSAIERYSASKGAKNGYPYVTGVELEYPMGGRVKEEVDESSSNAPSAPRTKAKDKKNTPKKKDAAKEDAEKSDDIEYQAKQIPRVNVSKLISNIVIGAHEYGLPIDKNRAAMKGVNDRLLWIQDAANRSVAKGEPYDLRELFDASDMYVFLTLNIPDPHVEPDYSEQRYASSPEDYKRIGREAEENALSESKALQAEYVNDCYHYLMDEFSRMGIKNILDKDQSPKYEIDYDVKDDSIKFGEGKFRYKTDGDREAEQKEKEKSKAVSQPKGPEKERTVSDIDDML